MSYRIEYGPSSPSSSRNPRHGSRVQTMTAVCLLLFSLLVRSFFPAGTEKLREILLPDSNSVVQSAYHAFLNQMQGGQSVTDAFTVFCQYVISHEEALQN